MIQPTSLPTILPASPQESTISATLGDVSFASLLLAGVADPAPAMLAAGNALPGTGNPLPTPGKILPLVPPVGSGDSAESPPDADAPAQPVSLPVILPLVLRAKAAVPADTGQAAQAPVTAEPANDEAEAPLRIAPQAAIATAPKRTAASLSTEPAADVAEAPAQPHPDGQAPDVAAPAERIVQAPPQTNRAAPAMLANPVRQAATAEVEEIADQPLAPAQIAARAAEPAEVASPKAADHVARPLAITEPAPAIVTPLPAAQPVRPPRVASLPPADAPSVEFSAIEPAQAATPAPTQPAIDPASDETPVVEIAVTAPAPVPAQPIPVQMEVQQTGDIPASEVAASATPPTARPAESRERAIEPEQTARTGRKVAQAAASMAPASVAVQADSAPAPAVADADIAQTPAAARSTEIPARADRAVAPQVRSAPATRPAPAAAPGTAALPSDPAVVPDQPVTARTVQSSEPEADAARTAATTPARNGQPAPQSQGLAAVLARAAKPVATPIASPEAPQASTPSPSTAPVASPAAAVRIDPALLPSAGLRLPEMPLQQPSAPVVQTLAAREVSRVQAPIAPGGPIESLPRPGQETGEAAVPGLPKSQGVQTSTAPSLPAPLSSQAAAPANLFAAVTDQSGMAPSATPMAQAAPTAPLARPQEFSALVDRLVEAREAARGETLNLAVHNKDFGQVSLRFTQDGGTLSVAVANDDPDFARAVRSAMPAGEARDGNSSTQGDRRDFSGSQGGRAQGEQTGATGDDAARRGRSEQAAGPDRARPGMTGDLPSAGEAELPAMGGILA